MYLDVTIDMDVTATSLNPFLRKSVQICDVVKINQNSDYILQNNSKNSLSVPKHNKVFYNQIRLLVTMK